MDRITRKLEIEKMKLIINLFYSDRLKLNLWDILKLLVGSVLGRRTSLQIGLWYMPKREG